MPRIVAGAVENLVATWDDERALFPYSSRLSEDGIVNDYDHPLALRYTLNSLLGLARAARTEDAVQTDDVLARFDRFRLRHSNRIGTLADAGMWLLLCAELEDEGGAAEALARVRVGVGSDRRPVMQDLAWALWGSAAGCRLQVPLAAETTRVLLGRILDEYTSPLGLPFHDLRWYRRSIVSFGAFTYFLRGLSEAATALEDVNAERVYAAGLQHAIALQGPFGDWPWLIDPVSGRALDRYPVFGVHQDSMAMLFLLPGLRRSISGVREAIGRSLDWTAGGNELGLPMYRDEPVFFAYRSIERREVAARARRYLRASANVLTGRTADAPSTGALRLNDECRSYHLGWILYAWGGHAGDAVDA